MLQGTQSAQWSYMALFTTMVEHADEMAEAYKACYGEDIVLADDEPTAAHAWMKRVLENDPVIFDSNNEVIQSVGEGQGRSKAHWLHTDPSGTGSGRQGGGIPNLEPLKMEPVFRRGLHELCGSGKTRRPHPNGAKLLLISAPVYRRRRWKRNGIKPFNTIGGWPVRPETTRQKAISPWRI